MRLATLLALAISLMLWAGGPLRAAPVKPGARVALVIANSTYTTAPALPNPVNDGRMVARSLKAAGFQTVTLVENQDRVGMERALHDFADEADHASIALIYYAGHGIESAGENFLIPTDAKLERERDLPIEAVKLSTVLDMIANSKLKIVILDACRTPPSTIQRATSTRAVSRGLAAVEPTGDSLVVYSAKAGTTALDGKGANSPFATAVSKRVLEPGREIEFVFREVRDDVLEATEQEQQPFLYGSLSGKASYFIDPPAGMGGGAIDVETEAYFLCRNAVSRGPCDHYLKSYPTGKYVVPVQGKLSDFGSGGAIAVAATPMRQEAPPQLVAGLGLTVKPLSDRAGLQVQSIGAESQALGQLQVGDVIAKVNMSDPAPGAAGIQQLSQAADAGPVRLLIQRGGGTRVVVLRREE